MVWEDCSCLGGCIGTICGKSNVSVLLTLIWLVMFTGPIISGQRQILSANWNWTLWCMKFLGSLFSSVDLSIWISNGFIWLSSLFWWPEAPYQCANKGAFSIFNFRPFLPLPLRNMPFLLTRHSISLQEWEWNNVICPSLWQDLVLQRILYSLYYIGVIYMANYRLIANQIQLRLNIILKFH